MPCIPYSGSLRKQTHERCPRPGCANCHATISLIEQVAQAKGVAVSVQKVEELRDIMSYGILSTPGVVIDGKVVHAGGVPSRDKIEQWLAAAQA